MIYITSLEVMNFLLLSLIVEHIFTSFRQSESDLTSHTPISHYSELFPSITPHYEISWIQESENNRNLEKTA
jgi:hypothetical protein